MITIALETHLPAQSTPEAIVSFDSGEKFKFVSYVQGKNSDPERAVSITVPIENLLLEAFHDALESGSKMTVTLKLPGVAGTPARTEISSITLKDVSEALLLRQECMIDMLKR